MGRKKRKKIRKRYKSVIKDCKKYCYMCGKKLKEKIVFSSYDTDTGEARYHLYMACPKNLIGIVHTKSYAAMFTEKQLKVLGKKVKK